MSCQHKKTKRVGNNVIQCQYCWWYGKGISYSGDSKTEVLLLKAKKWTVYNPLRSWWDRWLNPTGAEREEQERKDRENKSYLPWYFNVSLIGFAILIILIITSICQPGN